jgi:hypothetical protein
MDGGEKLKVSKDLPDADARFAELESLFRHFAKRHAA